MMSAVALALAFAPRWAAAQASDTAEMPPQQAEQKPHGIGYAISVAGGFSTFSRSSARDFLDTGGTWDVRGVFGTRTLFGLEVAYVGSAYGLDAPGGLTRTLYGHGLEGSGRINLLRNGLAFAGGLQPYLLGGIGWTHYHLSNNVSTASIDNSDNTLQVPVGAGLSYYFNNRLMLDARFAYRFAFSDNLIQGSSLDNYSLTARVGAEF